MTEQPGPPGPPPGGSEGQPTPPPPPPAPPQPPAGAPAQPPAVTGSTPPQPPYVATYDVAYEEEYNRWLPLVKWLLAIPHYIALFFLGIAAYVVLFIGFFAVLFTGEWPRGMFDFLVGVLRWASRVYAYVLFQTDEYPPFSLEDDPNYPVRVHVEYPEAGVARWRPLVSWLLVIPYSICAFVIFFVAEICAFLAFFTILFTKKYPRGLFDVVTVGLRWLVRDNVYRFWMTEQYPPFVWA